MIRTTVRALACAFMLISFGTATAAPSAIAAPGDGSYFSNQTTGYDPSVPGQYRMNASEVALGDQLQGQANDWAGTGSYTYFWQRCLDTVGGGCTPISGAT